MSAAPAAADGVIDLTADDDSSVEVQPPLPSSQQSNNPRRSRPNRVSPPTLARTDGTISRSNLQPFIDLTGEDDEINEVSHRHPSRAQASPARRQRPAARPRQPSLTLPLPPSSDLLVDMGVGPGPARPMPPRGGGAFSSIAARLGPLGNINALQGNYNALRNFASNWRDMRLDVTAGTYQAARHETPKPNREKTPPTTEGFTRNTNANPDEDMVAVCPLCSEELAYETGVGPSAATTKASGSRKRKRAPEHHFWALKKCGHVSRPGTCSVYCC